MNEPLTWALSRIREQTLLMVDDLAEEQWCRQAVPGQHHPAWVVGHLLLADSYLLHLLGVEVLPADFPDLLRAHGPGAVPTTAADAYLRPHRRLTERLERIGARRSDAVSRMTSRDLEQPTPDAELATTQPTLGHHLEALVFHEGHHGGQIAAWRQCQGLRAVPWILAPKAVSEPSSSGAKESVRTKR